MDFLAVDSRARDNTGLMSSRVKLNIAGDEADLLNSEAGDERFDISTAAFFNSTPFRCRSLLFRTIRIVIIVTNKETTDTGTDIAVVISIKTKLNTNLHT